MTSSESSASTTVGASLEWEAPTEAELIQLVREGHTDSYSELYRMHRDAARNMARRYARTIEGIDDLVSEAFARVLASLERGNGPSANFRSYLFTTIRRVAIDGYAKTDSELTVEDLPAVQAQAGHLQQPVKAFGDGVIADAFLSLPARWQRVLWLAEVEQLPLREVAEQLRMNSANASSLVYRAREGLRAAYLEHYRERQPAKTLCPSRRQIATHVRSMKKNRPSPAILAHAAGCEECTELLTELEAVNVRLGAVAIPLVGTLFAGGAGAALFQPSRASATTVAGATHASKWGPFKGPVAGLTTGGVVASALTLVAGISLATTQMAVPTPSPTSQSANEARKGPQTATENLPPEAMSAPSEPGAAPSIPSTNPVEGGTSGNSVADTMSVPPSPASNPVDTSGLLPPAVGSSPEVTSPDAAYRSAIAATEGVVCAYSLADPDGATTATDYAHGNSGTYRSTSGDISSGGSTALSGGTGYLADPVSETPPQQFSVEIWFRTTTPGGRLIGFGNAEIGTSYDRDRHLYMTPDGNIVFGVFTNITNTVKSPEEYADGSWHYAVGTYDAQGMRLYIDGKLVAADSTVTGWQDYSGYWRVGYDTLGDWGPDTPTNPYTGTLRYAGVYDRGLSPAEISNHWQLGRLALL